MAKKCDEDIPHPSQEKRISHAPDILLRKHGYTIYERSREATCWRLGDEIVDQEEALRRITENS